MASTSTYDVPKTGKAGVVVNAGPDFKVEVQDVPVPEPGPNDVLIKLNATGLCHTDLHYMSNDMPFPTMAFFGVSSTGHEGAGVVVKVGSNVQNWKVGQRAGIKPCYDACFACDFCLSGKDTHCDESSQIGIQLPGSYQQYLLSPARYTQRIPDGVDDFNAGPLMCAGSTVYSALRESGLKPGDWAVFPGAGGGVGHIGVQVAKAMGMRVVGVDGGDDKKELCIKLGCEAFVDFTKVEDVAAEVVKICDGKGAHGVIVTAGSAAAYNSAPAMCRKAGKIVCVGLPPADSSAAAGNPLAWIERGLQVIGIKAGTLYDTTKVLELAARGQVKPIYELVPLAKMGEAVDRLRSGKVAGRLVVDFNS